MLKVLTETNYFFDNSKPKLKYLYACSLSRFVKDSYIYISILDEYNNYYEYRFSIVYPIPNDPENKYSGGVSFLDIIRIKNLLKKWKIYDGSRIFIDESVLDSHPLIVYLSCLKSQMILRTYRVTFLQMVCYTINFHHIHPTKNLPNAFSNKHKWTPLTTELWTWLKEHEVCSWITEKDEENILKQVKDSYLRCIRRRMRMGLYYAAVFSFYCDTIASYKRKYRVEDLTQKTLTKLSNKDLEYSNVEISKDKNLEKQEKD